MSDNRFGPPEPIGQTPEWQEWFREALAYFEDHSPREIDWSLKKLSTAGIREDSIPQILAHDERTHVRHELVPLVRAYVHDYRINHYPWGYTP